MSSHRITPPWDYLHDASISSLESYELSRLNHAANIRREMAALIDQWIEDDAQALLARWILDDRAIARSAACEPETSSQSELPFGKPIASERALCGADPSSRFARRPRAIAGD